MSVIPDPTNDTIVVGVDTSPESIAALHWAAQLAARTGVHLLAVHAEGLLEEGAYVPRVDVAGLVAEVLSGTAQLATLTSLVEPGSPCEALMRVARRTGARHIVVGHRGAGDTGADIGSTALLLVSRSTVPVTVVRSLDPTS
ncbi:MAG: universal stress protein [Actinomycetota bacterium]|nr:universal stress protein [Actinomycetota bacterium]